MKDESRCKAARTTMMAGKKIIKLSTLSLSMLCITTAYAAETEDATTAEPKAKVVKVAVTGSSIKGVAAQSASPITVIKAEDLAKQGITTAEEALSTLSASQPSDYVTAQNVGSSKSPGSVANLRGLGSTRTLVLLNGRRIADSPFSPGSVNLNNIPLAMLQNIEVLRDGASAIYGADAIGGVINFITKDTFTGLNISAEYLLPEADSGDGQQYSIFGGFGDLDEQGYNLYGVVSHRKTDGVMAYERDVSKRGGVLPELGVNRTSSGTYPANFVDSNPDPDKRISGNPYAATGCGSNPLYFPNASGNLCRYNSQADIGIVPATEDTSFMGKLTAKITDNINAKAEYLFSESKVASVIAPDVYLGGGGDYFIPDSSKYYPGKGITPGVDGITGDLSLNLRSQAGNRQSETVNRSNRFLVGLEGDVLGWDINTGISYALSTATDNLTKGYTNNESIRKALANGTLNPFGAQAPEDGDVWNSFSIAGTNRKASLKATSIDFTASRPIYTLPAGDIGLAVGANYRREDWRSASVPEIVSVVESLGSDPNEPINLGKRELKAVFTELNIPLHKTLEAQLAARYDDYSDFGDTFNPKFGLRWEPIKQLMFRGTYSTGFRAPSLWEVNGPNSVTNTGATYNDPVLCPDGKPVTGAVPSRDCGMQFDRQDGGNKKLEAEESKSFTLGAVFEPIKDLVFTIDYYNITIENQISALTENAIFNDPAKYAAQYVRNPDGSLNYIITTNQNMGNTETSGFDIGANWRSPMTDFGRFTLGVDGTYIDKYDYQVEKDGPYSNVVGNYNADFGQAIIRWKHVAKLGWQYGDWSANLHQNYLRGYLDQNADGQNHRVDDYVTYNLSGTYKGLKNLELTLGVKNLFDEEPTASNVLDNFQMGYDPRYSDPLGRTYFVRGTYKFF